MKWFPILGLAVVIGGVMGCANHDPWQTDYPYYRPLNSPGTKFSGLPPAVQHTIRAEAGAAEIHDIVKEAAPNEFYTVYFRNSEFFPPLRVAPDGSVLSPNLTVAVGAPVGDVGIISGTVASGIKLGDLPKKVVETIQKRAPTTELAEIYKETHGAKVYYEVTFKDSFRYPRLYVLEDGTILGEVPE